MLNNIFIAQFQKTSIYELNFMVDNQYMCGTIWGLLVINYGFYVAVWHKTLDIVSAPKFNEFSTIWFTSYKIKFSNYSKIKDSTLL